MSLPGYLSIGLLSCLLMGSTMGGTPSDDCPSGLPLILNGYSYCYVSDEKTWDEAKIWCNRRWGELASLECDPVEPKIQEYLLNLAKKDVWITGAGSSYGTAYCLSVNKEARFENCELNNCYTKLPFLCAKPASHF